MPRRDRARGASTAPTTRGVIDAAVVVALVLATIVGCQSGTSTPSASPPGAAGPPRIDLPEIQAVELPTAGAISIEPTASPLRELLASASAGRLRVTNDVHSALPLGATLVTWTAWSGEPETSTAVTRRKAWVYVFPFGQTPAGVSGRYDATAGNHSAKVVRDGSGRVHVVWLDAERPGQGSTILYRSGIQDPATGRFVWDTPVSAITQPGSAVGLPALAASENALHFAWTNESTTRYMRVIKNGATWRAEPVRDTKTGGGAYDHGPGLAVRGDNEIYVLTFGGGYAVSTNGGADWRVERVPWPSGGVKNPALAVDALSNSHVVYVRMVRDSGEREGGRRRGDYWQLRYVRRLSQGGWVDDQDLLGAFPEWGDRGSDRDSLADWPDIAVDRQGNLHVVFHGDVNSGVFGQDEAFYVRRPTDGPGVWGAWERPIPLHPVSQAARTSYSYAPSLAIDPASDAVLAVVFFGQQNQTHEAFDSDALLLRAGRVVGGPIPLSQNARTAIAAGRSDDALSTWFAGAAPWLYHSPGGRIWLDVLYTARTPEAHASPHYVIYQRCDVTDRLR